MRGMVKMAMTLMKARQFWRSDKADRKAKKQLKDDIKKVNSGNNQFNKKPAPKKESVAYV